jgi:hypothetical protein
MKSVEHLKNRFLHVLFDRHARTERATTLVRIEHDRHELALRTLPQRARDLTHHRDVENIQRRLRERDTRDAIVDPEIDVIGHFTGLQDFQD